MNRVQGKEKENPWNEEKYTLEFDPFERRSKETVMERKIRNGERKIEAGLGTDRDKWRLK